MLSSFKRLTMRWRYPDSLPDDVAEALGIALINFSSFDQFIEQLSNEACCRPTTLYRFMPRQAAEAAFRPTARHTECFPRETLCSYYFCEGWLEFILQFDEDNLLRRIWLQHKLIPHQQGCEIHLSDFHPI